MDELLKALKIDKDGLFYLDSKSVQITPITFEDHSDRFFLINGIDNYIIKDMKGYPILFNAQRIKSMLKNFYNIKEDIHSIDIPIGYYKESKLKGIIIPYYKDSISIRSLMNTYNLNNVKKYYNHDDDAIDNIVTLYLDILHLIREMYEKNIVYKDINSGNFMLFNNKVKVIDFEPGYVKFTKYKEKYYEYIVYSYMHLINSISRNLCLSDCIFHPDENFDKTEEKVKELKKRIRR